MYDALLAPVREAHAKASGTDSPVTTPLPSRRGPNPTR
jgi:hypothetical protein